MTRPVPDRSGAAAPRSPGWRRVVDDDEGAMTVMTAFAVAAVLALTVAVLLVGRAAVAGAHALRAGQDACAAAAGIAASNSAELSVCRVDGHDVVARAEVRVDLGVFGVRSGSAVARAGPA